MQNVEDKLMRSVLENDQQTIDEGTVIEEAINRGIGSFNPDLMFESLVRNYSLTKSLFGEALIRAISGYDPDYIERNIGIPEFQKELKRRIDERLDQMKRDKLIDKQGLITDKGIEMAALILYTQELDNIIPKGIHGEKTHKKRFIYGDKQDSRQRRKGDRYKDFAIKQTVKMAIRRGHENVQMEDFRTFERRSKGEVCIIYGLDSSGSMKGDKISVCKKAGVALAYRAIQERDSVGLVVFGTEVTDTVTPTKNFGMLLKAITRIKAAAETDMGAAIKRSIEMFPNQKMTKHLLLLTDSLPTKGEDPEKETVEAALVAAANDVTISIIGINLDVKGRKLAEKVVEIGSGKLYSVKDLGEINKIVLEDYYAVV
jgi:Mg-chelatase subunit ChlD